MVRALLEVRRRGKHPAAIVWSPLNKRRYHRGPGSPGLHTAARGAAASGRLPRSDSKRVSSTMNESPPPPLPHTHTHTGQKFSAFRFLPYALISLCRRERAPLLRLCICLLGNSDTSSVSRKGEQFVLFLENYFFPALLVHSKILRSLEIEENCFFLGTYFIPLFEHFLRNLEINAKNLSQKLFLSDSRTILFLIPIFVYLLENFARKEDYWRRTCREIRN